MSSDWSQAPCGPGRVTACVSPAVGWIPEVPLPTPRGCQNGKAGPVPGAWLSPALVPSRGCSGVFGHRRRRARSASSRGAPRTPRGSSTRSRVSVCTGGRASDLSSPPCHQGEQTLRLDGTPLWAEPSYTFLRPRQPLACSVPVPRVDVDEPWLVPACPLASLSLGRSWPEWRPQRGLGRPRAGRGLWCARPLWSSVPCGLLPLPCGQHSGDTASCCSWGPFGQLGHSPQSPRPARPARSADLTPSWQSGGPCRLPAHL